MSKTKYIVNSGIHPFPSSIALLTLLWNWLWILLGMWKWMRGVLGSQKLSLLVRFSKSLMILLKPSLLRRVVQILNCQWWWNQTRCKLLRSRWRHYHQLLACDAHFSRLFIWRSYRPPWLLPGSKLRPLFPSCFSQ